MVKRISLPTVAGIKITDDVLLFLVFSIVSGFTFGIGTVLGNVFIKSALKRVDLETDILPQEAKEEVFDKSINAQSDNPDVNHSLFFRRYRI